MASKPHVLIIGSGIAGLSLALRFSEVAQVTIVCKSTSDEGSTRYAQGGIASVWSKNDSYEQHIQDTLQAGAGLCDSEIVRMCVENGPARVRELIERGVQFSRIQGQSEDYDLHREGGHQVRRILHNEDQTGLAIEEALLTAIKEKESITLKDYHVVVDLVTEGKILQKWRKPGRCLGAYVLDEKSGHIEGVSADLVFLATGGAGKVYLYTSNPDVSTGDGIAMAYRAGARVANCEFVQFHPTCLYHRKAKNFLISEALRGEGAELVSMSGEPFMKKAHPMGSLAPRDIVARAIDAQIKKTGDRYVLLDATKISNVKQNFPKITQTCLNFGVDISVRPIPVVPAAHYFCGGVLVDSWGRSTVEGLYAVGEAACTGFHGANRLASNSLLEAVVFAERAFQKGKDELQEVRKQGVLPPPLPEWDTGRAVELEEQIDIAATWLEIRTLMWNYVGLVRSNDRLLRAKKRLELIRTEIQNYYWNYLLTRDLIELRNILVVGSLIVQCAEWRKESRGLHYNVDYPQSNEHFLKKTVM